LFDQEASHKALVTAVYEVHEKELTGKEQLHAKTAGDQKASLSKLQRDMANMISRHAVQKKELDSSRASVVQLEQTLAKTREELQASTQAQQQQLEIHKVEDQNRTEQQKQLMETQQAEMEKMAAQYKRETDDQLEQIATLRAQHEKEIQQLQASHEEGFQKRKDEIELRATTLAGEHDRKLTDMEAVLLSTKGELEALAARFAEEQDAHAVLKSEHAKAQEQQDKSRSQFVKATEHYTELAEVMLNLRSRQAEWQQESDRMSRILESLGQLGADASIATKNESL
jgi:superfamily I DNA and/or RNA helicase